MKKLLLIVVFIAMPIIANILLVTAAENNTDSDDAFGGQTAETDVEIHSSGAMQYNLMLEYFESITGQKRVYPDFYAGMYRGKDGTVVVMVTEDSSEVIESIKKGARSSNFRIEVVEKSYDEIFSTKEYISDCFVDYMSMYEENEKSIDEELKELILSFVGCGISEKRNCVNVRINNLTKRKIDLFKKYFTDLDWIVFEESEFPEYFSKTVSQDNGNAAGSVFRITVSQLIWQHANYFDFFYKNYCIF